MESRRPLRTGIRRDPDALRRTVRIEDVIASLCGGPLYSTARSNELRCKCWRPEHAPDTRPSCRIDIDKQVFFCDVCGSGGDVFTVVRERDSSSFWQAVEWLAEHREMLRPPRILRLATAVRDRPRHRSPVHRGGRDIYPYYDREWRLLFEKIRTPEKQFFYRRPGRNERKLWGLGGVQPVLYLLPALDGLPFVLIVEGEKDVEAAWDRYLPATTNPEGAGNGKWKERYTRQLVEAGIKRVYVIPDNDAVGHLHAEQIMASCRRAGLRAWMVPLSGVPLHGDLSDYLNAGHTRRDVFREMRKARRAN
jgi:hypothetical protein